MQLILKNGDSEKRLVIQLLEGHTPRVADFSNDDESRSIQITENLEPAIWFKVMVVESISIDCKNRIVSWSNGRRDKNGNTALNMIYTTDRSCYDFDDDIDELFNLGVYLIENNPLCDGNQVLSHEQMTEYERSVIRILHCYVLNKVIFQPFDIESIRSALTSQQKAISQIEDNVLVHSRLAEHYLAQMRNLRELEILPVLDQLIGGSMVTKEFIESLLIDLKKVELALRDEVDHSQRRVDDIKDKLYHGRSSQLSHELECLRHERNHNVKNLQLHLVGREVCRIAIAKQSDDIEMNTNCSRYMKLRKRVLSEKGSAACLVAKKIRAVSVRECIESVIKELETGVESTGDDTTVDGQRVTDVINEDKKAPEWQTLTQRLFSIVYNKDHPVGIAFRNFCIDVLENYQVILQTIEHLANDPQIGSSSTYKDFYVISERDYGLTTFFLENQQNLILSHIYQVTELIAEGFHKDWNMLVRKIRLCYEKCLYHRIGHDLMLMYRIVYDKTMKTLEEQMSKLQAIEIHNLNLQMNCEWWHEIFEVESTEPLLIDSIDAINPHNFNLNGYVVNIDKGKFNENVEFTDFEEEEYSDRRSTGGITDRFPFDTDGLSHYFENKDLNDEVFSHVASGKNISSNYKNGKRKSMQPHDTFELHFGAAMKSIKRVFAKPSPLKKMQCLTGALKLIANKVEELRMRGRNGRLVDHADIAVTAEDLLPLIALIILKMVPREAAQLYVELIFVSDMMAEFLSAGCHSYALCEFQIAFRVLDQTWEEMSL